MFTKDLLLGAAALAMGSLAYAGPASAGVYDLKYNGMSAPASCPDGSCGTVTVTGDPTSSLMIDVALAEGVSFHGNSNDFFYFDVTGGTGVTITAATLTGDPGHTYAFNGIVGGAYQPQSAGNFPGPYNYAAVCTPGSKGSDAGNLCGTELKFTINGGSTANPLVLDGPSAGTGDFANIPMLFVADLSVSGSCGDATCGVGTGLVGAGVVAAPEPSTWAMLGLGFAALGFAGYRKARGERAIAA
jgi:uncharacterized low-complexity protein